MNIEFRIFLLMTIVFCSSCSSESMVESIIEEPDNKITVIPDRLSAQIDIASNDQIIDDLFIPIGSGNDITKLRRNMRTPYLNAPVYHFEAAGDANRIEFTTCFGSEENLSNYSQREIDKLISIKDGYINSIHGDYGDEITYEWNTRFLNELEAEQGGIFAQWHGRPDRTLVRNPQGVLEEMAVDDFLNLLTTMYFDNNIGKDLVTNQPNGWLVDGSAGGPIAAFHFRDNYLYLIVRNEPNRQSNPDIKVKPKPGIHLNQIIETSDGKTGSIAFEMKKEEVPINEWIHFKVVIKYSKYSHTEDAVLESGGLKLWMNGVQVADWKGDIGKNDKLGPYFKFGIYKPGSNGFKVDCNGFKQKIRAS